MDAQISGGDLGKPASIPPFAKCREGWGTRVFVAGSRWGCGFCGWFEIRSMTPGFLWMIEGTASTRFLGLIGSRAGTDVSHAGQETFS